MTELPDYDSLPAAGGRGRSGWGLFGEQDNVGLINLQTPDRVARACRLVQTGQVFPLDIPLDFFPPPDKPGERGAPRHVLQNFDQTAFDDSLDGFFLQGTTQWDALGHVGFRRGAFYNGARPEDIEAGRRNTIDHWARRGIVGRAVLLDMVRALAARGEELDPFGGYAITVDDLEAAREQAGLRFQPGDVILLRTGHLEALARLPAEQRRIRLDTMTTPGLAHCEEMARYVWNTHAAAVAADNMAVEVWPALMDPAAGDLTGPQWPFGYLHNAFIGLFGLAMGEYFWLADLAGQCARDGRYEMLFTSAPLNVRGVGSPANALVIW
ncbi:MAG: cyclase family protein [Streptosporangiaceae bacterium]|jgi:hypothetical protein